MKFNKRTTALLAVAGAALLVQPSRATTPTYNAGDLLIGFSQTGGSTDVVADIGPITNYISTSLNSSLASSSNLTTPGTATPGSTFIVQFGVNPSNSAAVTSIATDLSNTFGASWASNSGTGLVQWGIIGATSHTGTTYGLPSNTLFFTQAETTPGTQSTPPTLLTNNAASTADTKVNAAATGSTAGYKSSTETANSTVVVTESTSGANNWTAANNDSTGPLPDFNTGYNIEQGGSGTNIGPTNSTLDLYFLQPGGVNGGGAATYLGDFSLNSAGQLTFTTIPEPSTYAMLGFGAIATFIAIRRRRTPVLARA